MQKDLTTSAYEEFKAKLQPELEELEARIKSINNVSPKDLSLHLFSYKAIQELLKIVELDNNLLSAQQKRLDQYDKEVGVRVGEKDAENSEDENGEDFCASCKHRLFCEDSPFFMSHDGEGDLCEDDFDEEFEDECECEGECCCSSEEKVWTPSIKINLEGLSVEIPLVYPEFNLL